MAAFDPPRNGEVASRSDDGGGGPSLRRPAVYAARRMRQAMTLPEVLLWSVLRSRPHGLKFRRQHPIGPYVTDFCCVAARLVIEVDGIVHDMSDVPARDERRDCYLKDKGFEVLRIPANEVLLDVSAVAETVVRAASPLRQSLRDCHLPASGEDFQ